MTELCVNDAAYVLGALSPADRAAYEEHLKTCADCQASVRRLAGMPGLLALARPDAAPDPELPSTLLPALTARVLRFRRRRVRIIAGLVAASFAVMIALVGSLLFRVPGGSTDTAGTVATGQPSASASQPPTAAGQAPVDETDQMTQVVPGPMSASLELVDKRWGTAITVICQYEQGIDTSIAYDLAVIDVDGQQASGGSWRGVPGATSRVAAATAVPRDKIAAFEIRLPDGRTILQSVR